MANDLSIRESENIYSYKWRLIRSGIFAVAIMIAASTALTALTMSANNDDRILKQRGVPTKAIILEKYIYDGGLFSRRHHHIPHVKYYYSINNVKYKKDEQTFDMLYNSVNVGSKIDVIYDPDNPIRSHLNFDDWIHQGISFDADLRVWLTLAADILFGILAMSAVRGRIKLYNKARSGFWQNRWA